MAFSKIIAESMDLTDTYAFTGTVTGAGGANTPAFMAYMSADQSSVSDNVWTKPNMNTEFFDTDSKYDTSNYRFTPTVSGKYMFCANLLLSNATNQMNGCSIAFYKNGTKLLYNERVMSGLGGTEDVVDLTGIIDLDTDDYVEIYVKADIDSGGTYTINQDGTTSNNRCYWYGYKIIT
jgi:hypothetical protein|tara:strand:+ start:1465 stop:1998 length:534 start_codon:yes stop_codon:yes gene_type:complete